MLLREAVGVVAVGQQQHLHVHTLGQQHVDATDRGVYAGGVAVVEHGDVAREAAYEAYLPSSERRARRRDDVLNAALVHRRNVDVALYEIAAVLLRYGVLGLVYAVKLVALVVDERFRRVDVLGRLLVVAQYAPSESYHAPRNGVHGEDHTPCVAVLQAAVVALVAQARVDQILLLEALG